MPSWVDVAAGRAKLKELAAKTAGVEGQPAQPVAEEEDENIFEGNENDGMAEEAAVGEVAKLRAHVDQLESSFLDTKKALGEKHQATILIKNQYEQEKKKLPIDSQKHVLSASRKLQKQVTKVHKIKT